MAKSLALWVESSNDAPTTATTATTAATAATAATLEADPVSCAAQREFSDYSASPGIVSVNGASSDNEIELHINYWLLQEDTGFELNYLDVGVKFGGMGSSSYINMYFPFKVTKDSYCPSLGALVCSRSDLIQTIFNSRYESTENVSNTAVDIKLRGEGTLRFHTQIDLGAENGGVTVRDTGEGSTISFPLSLFNLKASSPTDRAPNYFRFRIKLDREKSNISQVYQRSDRYILNRLESIEIVDFRLNEVRDLPGVIQSKDLVGAGIRNIHFFLIREVSSEYKQSHADYKRCRLLERELWDDYLNADKKTSKKIPEQMLIYHWKESSYKKDNSGGPDTRGEPIEKFTAFAKFGKITVTKKTILHFILVALALGAIAGLVGNLLTSLITNAYGFLVEWIVNFCIVHFS